MGCDSNGDMINVSHRIQSLFPFPFVKKERREFQGIDLALHSTLRREMKKSISQMLCVSKNENEKMLKSTTKIKYQIHNIVRDSVYVLVG